MTTPQRCRAKLADKIIQNQKFVQYFFELIEPHEVQFQAGQYVSLKVSERGDRRSYSICSSPEKNHGFELLIDISPQGLGTSFLSEMTLGQEVDVLMPLGVFTVSQASDEQAVIFLGTGSGIAPFRSMILDQLQAKHDTRPIVLHWGLREVNQLFWQDEFQELAESFPNFHFHPVISRPTNEWPLCRGRVTDCLRTHEFNQQAGYYLCGNAAMLQETLTILQEKGILPGHIHHEKFF